MNDNMDAGRRRFLAAASGIGATLGFGSMAGAAPPSVDKEVQTICDAAGYDFRAAARIAQAYWATGVEDRDATRLTEWLRHRAAASDATGDVPKRLRLCIQEDFTAGRTVNVDGWILSETETRICALKTLLAG